MKAFFLIIAWIFGTMLVGVMIIYSSDKEYDVQQNKDKAYKEYIERESVR